MSGDVRRRNEEQFTRTAGRFAASRFAERQAQTEALIRLTTPARDDRVLDVACGPGAVLAAFAPLVRHAVGVDLTIAMLREARARGREGQRLSLVCGAGERLPFGDGAFSLAVTTWAVHHFADPRGVLSEMVRVVRPGGRLVVGDSVASTDPGRRARQNAIERVRDPSHVEMLSAPGLASLLESFGLVLTGTIEGEMPRDLEEWCQISGASPEVAARVRTMLIKTIPGDLAGLAPVADGSTVRFRHRWVIVAGRKP